MGEMGTFAQQGLDELQSQGAVPLTAWQVFEQADAALAVVAGLTLGLVLLNAVGALAARQDGLLVVAGLVASALVAYKLVNPPGPDVADGGRPAARDHRRLHGAGRRPADGGRRAGGHAGRLPPPAPPAAAPVPPTAAAGQVKVWDAS